MADVVSRGREYLGEVRTEMAKVTWPDWPQLKNATLVILVFVTVITLLITGIDVLVRMGLGFFSALFGG
ncbi:MAG: preprotein translocase subunit SecE [Longimicrobiaceae bacterium]